MLGTRSQTPGPRPRPPAKLRRESELTRSVIMSAVAADSGSSTTRRQVSSSLSTGSASPITSSPPPAYGTGYELGLPEERDSVVGEGGGVSDTLLGSPMVSTFKMMGYRSMQHLREGDEDGGGDDVFEEWMNAKSKEELAGLLVKAEDLIKERENELGLTSTVVKNLYENNVALKTKHEALLARLPPPSPSPGKQHSEDDASSSPDRVISRSSSLGYASHYSRHMLDEPESPSPPPPPPLYRGHARKVSMSTADISLLADQNAELMSKLEQLESESTSADHAGRRELRRLEKEIAMLRQALEKTQAKSEELEAKTKGLDRGIDRVVEDAWKRKKEREQRMRAMRNSAQQHWLEDPPVRDFAPRGSTFGGPSKHFPLSRSSSRPTSYIDTEEDEDEEGVEGVTLTIPTPIPPKPELEIMSQLLQKVKELEQTNARILHQQAETTNQLQAVQRDTEVISKVYECLADPQEVELERALEGELALASSMSSAKFGSFKRRLESDRIKGHGGKARRSVVGLFGEQAESTGDLPAVPFASWINEGRHRASYSMGGGSGRPSPSLASLSFNSPREDILAELSPLGSRLTLENELQYDQTSWESEQLRSSWHFRSQSLSNISQLSMPSSPLMSSSELDDKKTPMNADFPHVEAPPPQPQLFPSPSPPQTPPQPMPGTLPVQPGFHVEPPTPSKDRELQQQPSFDSENGELNMQGTRSPRHEFISQRIRARKARWEDGRFGSLSSTTSIWVSPTVDDERIGFRPVFVPPPKFSSGNGSPSASLRSRSVTPAMGTTMRISTIVDTLVDQFDGDAGGSPESDYEDAADHVSESYDEEDREEETGDEYGDDEEDDEGDLLDDDDEETMVHRTPQFSEGNALQLHQTGQGAAQDKFPSSKSYEDGALSRRGSVSGKNAVPSTSKSGQGKWGSVLLELWLWLQFAVIIFVFLCAMAKRGPKAVLADAEQRTRTRKESMHLRRK